MPAETARKPAPAKKVISNEKLLAPDSMDYCIPDAIPFHFRKFPPSNKMVAKLLVNYLFIFFFY